MILRGDSDKEDNGGEREEGAGGGMVLLDSGEDLDDSLASIISP